jgi:hypothetical protein
MREALVSMLVLAAATIAGACAATREHAPDPNELTEGERAEGWKLLFDGQTTRGWRGYKSSEMPAGWQVVDGALTRVAEAGDIVTEEEFGEFELVFEWQVAPGGNSGVMFHVTEDHEYAWQTGPEYQILDDAGHRDGGDPLTSAGANYAMHAAERGVARPAGEWNQSLLRVTGTRVEHWLNGKKLVEYDLWSPDWKRRVEGSKWRDHPDYGMREMGRIALQDHGDRVAYRGIRIRVLD